MGKCYSCCMLKCFPCCGKKIRDGKRTPSLETVPKAMNSTSTNTSAKDGDLTYAEFVTSLSEQCEKKRQSDKAKKTGGSFARWLERITCCKLFRKQQPPLHSSFWIEPPPGYLERRYEDM